MAHSRSRLRRPGCPRNPDRVQGFRLEMPHINATSPSVIEKSIGAPWMKKELDVVMNRGIASGEVVVLPLLYEECELPEFLKGKLYADFSKDEHHEDVLGELLRRLRIT